MSNQCANESVLIKMHLISLSYVVLPCVFSALRLFLYVVCVLVLTL